jgi:choline-sulfatase
LVADALMRGARTSWDHQPFTDTSHTYMRNHLKLDDVEAMARFPAVPPN